MSTHARPLAVRLAEVPDDDELAALFAARGVKPDIGWSDFFDAAEALLTPASIEHVLLQLTRAEAVALRGAVDTGTAVDRQSTRASLIDLALLLPDGTVPPPVADAVRSRPEPDCFDEITAEAASEHAAALAAEQAFTSIATIADLLILASETPLTVLTDGRLSAGEKRRLADAGTTPEHLDALITLAVNADLLTTGERRLHTSERGAGWLRDPAAARWARLASAFRSALPRGLRTPAGGWAPAPSWPHEHPWDPGWAQQSAALRERAVLLGLIAADGTEPEWAVPLRLGEPAEPAALERMLPTEVDKIFLQNDLSAIAPGPLAPALDVRLRGIAVRESAAQASSYRFTAESIGHALTSGESAASILDFLRDLSLTGIPQPLEYLVTQTAQRHGLVRVLTEDDSGLTRITSPDATLLDAMGVDQSLRPLALARDAAGLTSRVGRDTVYWTLTDARYPAVIVDADGEPRVIERHLAPARPSGSATDYRPLIARLRAHQGPDADAAWLDRELEAAVRAKALLLVEIQLPDGTTRELQIEATGMGGGRLRGLDRAADVERTLPVSSIRSAHIVDATADDS